MTDVLRIELNDLSPKTENPWAGGLCKPTLATDAATRVLQSAVGSQDTVMLLCNAITPLVLFAQLMMWFCYSSVMSEGWRKIKFFFETDNISYAAVTLWEGLAKTFSTRLVVQLLCVKLPAFLTRVPTLGVEATLQFLHILVE